jgi:hypothetical protein
MRKIRKIVWATENSGCYSMNDFLEIINESKSKVPESLKSELFIIFETSDESDFPEAVVQIGYDRPETEEEKAINNKLEEENEKRRYNRLKADFERLKAKFEKT